MIKITVKLENESDIKYEDINITKEDLKQLACDKIKDKYIDNYWNSFQAEDDIEINIK